MKVAIYSQLPLLTICRLPFNVFHEDQNQQDKYSTTTTLIILPTILHTAHLRTLALGMNTSSFLKRLLECIPFIGNLSIGVEDSAMNEGNTFDKLPLATMSFNAADLCSRVNELFLFDSIDNNCTSVVDNCKSSIMSLVHGSLITKITIDGDGLVKAAELKSTLRMAYNVNTLEICGETGILLQAILHNTDNLGTRADDQV
ncbi:unnamed protein product [Rotaria socialis]|uniref:Uncharacterized protein n=1 Tax=Rotaria socialis TaxID=392032 RepID=A0A818L2B2_9BILA|nr:unnamed protein product [Rotaria socialis]CAF3567190.1 unnamed protein product [Rotaria socialis]